MYGNSETIKRINQKIAGDLILPNITILPNATIQSKDIDHHGRNEEKEPEDIEKALEGLTGKQRRNKKKKLQK